MYVVYTGSVTPIASFVCVDHIRAATWELVT